MTLRGPGLKSKSQLEIRILVYGRIMRVKGSETVAASASLLQRQLWPGISVRFIFAGADWECSIHSRATSQCVKKILPRDFPVTFLGAIDHSGLLNLLPTIHGAIFASTFETFGMAPHELASTGLPIVITDIPAYSEYFSEQNTYMFSVDNATTLGDATLILVRDLVSHRPRRAEFKYADAVPVYERVISAEKANGTPAPDLDLRLLESSIARLEAECWPNRECRRVGLSTDSSKDSR
jgi:glycosyltransferase involved in cell wall biosynthesis